MTHGHGHHGGHHQPLPHHHDHGSHHHPLPHHHEQHHQPHGHHHHPHGHVVPVVIPMPVTYSYLPTATVGTLLLVPTRPPSSSMVGLLTCIGCFVLIVVLVVLWI